MSMSLGSICEFVNLNRFTKIISIADNIIPHEEDSDKLLCRYFIGSIDGFITMSSSVLSSLATFRYKKPKILTPHAVPSLRRNETKGKSTIKFKPFKRGQVYFVFWIYTRL